ncbi:MAG: ion channel [Candidatus Caenarcaniphilales bacterium]|nr:ion channel [Candidatus Caenarcaniphilales bacterium]
MAKSESITNRNDNLEIKVMGLPKNQLEDLYHYLLRISWWYMLWLLLVLYLAINLAFALLYLLEPGSVADLMPGDFVTAFFFSVETLNTIGYGTMHPITFYGHTLVTVEAFIGVLFSALTTGLIFAKFSIPQSRVIFSDKAVIHQRNGMPHLSFRIANGRQNHIVQAQISVSILLNEKTLEGYQGRKLSDLKLLRSTTPAFSLSWSVYHPIDSESPLYGLNSSDLAKEEAVLIVTLVGLDNISGQTVHARYVYSHDQILWDHTFRDLFAQDSTGRRYLDHALFHKVKPLSMSHQAESVST